MTDATATSNRFAFSSPWFYRIGLGVMLFLLVLAAILWRERTWMLDIAFQTFLMIKDGTTQVMVFRFGAATIQSLPLLGIKLALPLATVSWLYSISFHLHFLAFFLLSGTVFKRQDIALGIAFLYTAFTFDGFYWQTSELQQGLGFLLLSWAALLRFPILNKWWQYPIWAATIIALAFYHPLVFMPFYFMLFWLWWKPAFKKAGRKTLLFLGAVMFAVLVVKQIWFQNWYDAQKTQQFTRHLTEDFPNYFSYPAYSLFLKDLITHWWGYGLLLLLVSGVLVKTRQLWGLAFLWSTTLGFLLLSAIGDPLAEHRFYVEVNYYPLLAFVLVPLVIEIFPHWQKFKATSLTTILTKQSSNGRKTTVALLFLIIFFIARLSLITWNSQNYTARVDYLRELSAQAQQQRQVVNPTELNQELLRMDWGLPYETLIQSATETNRPVTLLSLENIATKQTELNTDSLFVTPWAAFPLDQVNERGYWTLPATPYVTPKN